MKNTAIDYVILCVALAWAAWALYSMFTGQYQPIGI